MVNILTEDEMLKPDLLNSRSSLWNAQVCHQTQRSLTATLSSSRSIFTSSGLSCITASLDANIVPFEFLMVCVEELNMHVLWRTVWSSLNHFIMALIELLGSEAAFQQQLAGRRANSVSWEMKSAKGKRLRRRNSDRSDVNLEQHLTRSPVKDYFVFIFSSFIIFQYIKQHTVGEGGDYLIPCWFCTFSPWQRNYQYNFNGRLILTARDRINTKNPEKCI